MDELQQAALDACPNECCGLLFGRKDRISGYELTANVADLPARQFEIDPAALIAAERNSRQGIEPILGYFHSHPSGEVQPSQTDAEKAAPDGRHWLIVNGKDAAVWRAVPNGEIFGRFDPISLECTRA